MTKSESGSGNGAAFLFNISLCVLVHGDPVVAEVAAACDDLQRLLVEQQRVSKFQIHEVPVERRNANVVQHFDAPYSERLQNRPREKVMFSLSSILRTIQLNLRTVMVFSPLGGPEHIHVVIRLE